MTPVTNRILTIPMAPKKVIRTINYTNLKPKRLDFSESVNIPISLITPTTPIKECQTKNCYDKITPIKLF